MAREREERGTFRVAVKPRSRLEASLQFGGRQWSATVGDVSAEGIFIKLEAGALPAPQVDSRVNVEIRFDDEHLVLHGVVRSQREGGYGIFFPERNRQGRINPVAKLARVTAHLQRTDLSQRLQVLKLPE